MKTDNKKPSEDDSDDEDKSLAVKSEEKTPRRPSSPSVCTCVNFLRLFRFFGALGALTAAGLTLAAMSALRAKTDEISTTAVAIWAVYLVFQFLLAMLTFCVWIESGCVAAQFPLFDGWIGSGTVLMYLAVSTLVPLNFLYNDASWALGVCAALACLGTFSAVAGCCGGKRYVETETKKRASLM
jgi:hypothetical protein